jgi:hypothetical protein
LLTQTQTEKVHNIFLKVVGIKKEQQELTGEIIGV